MKKIGLCFSEWEVWHRDSQLFKITFIQQQSQRIEQQRVQPVQHWYWWFYFCPALVGFSWILWGFLNMYVGLPSLVKYIFMYLLLISDEDYFPLYPHCFFSPFHYWQRVNLEPKLKIESFIIWSEGACVVLQRKKKHTGSSFSSQ